MAPSPPRRRSPGRSRHRMPTAAAAAASGLVWGIIDTYHVTVSDDDGCGVGARTFFTWTVSGFIIAVLPPNLAMLTDCSCGEDMMPMHSAPGQSGPAVDPVS